MNNYFAKNGRKAISLFFAVLPMPFSFLGILEFSGATSERYFPYSYEQASEETVVAQNVGATPSFTAESMQSAVGFIGSINSVDANYNEEPILRASIQDSALIKITPPDGQFIQNSQEQADGNFAGVVYRAKQGDTLSTIAARFSISESAIVYDNDLNNDSDLKAGQVLRLVGAKVPVYQNRNESENDFNDYDKSEKYKDYRGGNSFPYGYCTYYVASKRAVPWHGNAGAWFRQAINYGFAVGKEPSPGAIVVTGESRVGHVAYVESVNADGSFVVSEMNYVGWGIVNTRTMKKTDKVIYGFIY